MFRLLRITSVFLVIPLQQKIGFNECNKTLIFIEIPRKGFRFINFEMHFSLLLLNALIDLIDLLVLIAPIKPNYTTQFSWLRITKKGLMRRTSPHETRVRFNKYLAWNSPFFLNLFVVPPNFEAADIFADVKLGWRADRSVQKAVS